MAVDRRAKVTLSSVVGNTSRVRAPGFTDKVGRFESVDGEIRWHEGQRDFAVVDSVWRATGALRDNSWAINLDTAEFADPERNRKIGIGSSAALTAALCVAAKGSTDIGTIMTTAQRAHSDLQRGAGSGVDIACSLSGGLIDYRMEGASVMKLDWPKGLAYRLIWTGVSASTRDKLSKLNAGISKPSRVRLVAASERMAHAWRSGDAGGIVKEYRGYTERLRQFSVDHDLGIFDAGHDELWQAANEVHLVYKPCGAGGGDVGIVLGRDEAALDSFTGKMAPGFSLLDCSLSHVGAKIETSEAGLE
jgi:phosphomevalonate kinase